MKMRDTMLNVNSYPGTSCLPRWNVGLSLASGLAQEKTLNNEMGNSNRVADADSVSCHSQRDVELSYSNFHEKCNSVQSGDENSNYVAKHDFQSKPTCSAASSGVTFSQQSIDFRQPFPCAPFSYAELYTGGMFHSYKSHAVLHSNVSGLASPRVPLPRQPSSEELIYVNPKQYQGILRRRQLRAKLEARKKPNGDRKPYLHESRHLHAMRRVRGSGGRFVNTKQNNQKAPRIPSSRNGDKSTSTTTPSSNVASLFCQNQSNYFNQSSCSDHTSYTSELSGEQHMHHWVSTILPS